MLSNLRALFAPRSTKFAARKPGKRSSLGVERLDRRDLPSVVGLSYLSTVTANLSSATGVLTITGDDAANQVSITETPHLIGGLTYLQVNGATSTTIDGAPSGPLYIAPMVRALQVNLGGGSDIFSVNRSAVAYNTATGFWQANPWHNSLTSGTINGGAGADRIDLSGANPATFTVNGGNDPDTLVGGPGTDTLAGGSGGDTISGNGGKDTLFGADPGNYSYTDGKNWLFGNDGNDALYGGNGGNWSDGGAGNDGLFVGNNNLDGGSGYSTQNYNVLIGGPGADRFLTMVGRPDYVADRNLDDAVIHFASANNIDYRAWKDAEVQAIDTGLATLVGRTNNTSLLKLSNGIGELTIQRINSIPTTPGFTVLADNDSAGTIRFTDSGVLPAKVPGKTLIHEIGHNWDTPEENPYFVDQFRNQSGWLRKVWYLPVLSFQTLSGDGNWVYNTTALFSRNDGYGKTNPLEDWSTSWEAYFFPTATGSLGGAPVAAKNSVLDQFFSAWATK